MTAASKIKIKLGAIEVEYEGSETFLKEELPHLLGAVSDLYRNSSGSLGVPRESAPDAIVAAEPSLGAEKRIAQGTTNSIAVRLQARSGPDLLLAAAAKLTLADRMDVFTRKRLVEEMRSASAYFNPNYVKNLSSLLRGLIKDGKLNEPNQGSFALTARAISELESRLA